MKDFKKIYQSYLSRRELEHEDFNLIEPRHINNEIINYVIQKNDLTKLKQIFNSEKFKTYIDVNMSNGIMLQEVSKKGNLEMFKYLYEVQGALLTKENTVIILVNAMVWNHTNILDYLVFKARIELTEEIEKILLDVNYENEMHEKVHKMFTARNLQETLNTKRVLENRLKV